MLKENEWITINSFLLKIYAIKDFDKFTCSLLKMFRMLIPYSKGYFLIFDENNEINIEESHFIEMSKESQNRYLDYFYDIDYIKYVLDFEKSTSIYRDTDILDDDIRGKTEFFKDFLKFHDIPFGCGILLIKNERLYGIVNLFRSEMLGNFTDKDMYILDILKEHIFNIIENFNIENSKIKHKNKIPDDFFELNNLSLREKEIVQLMDSGYSNLDIAEKLIISISTVKKHVYNIYSKLGVKSRTQLLACLHS